MGRLAAYLPMDRRHELAGAGTVPERARGVALFADLAGFTQLTDRLAISLGPEQGAEELTRLLDAVLGGIVERVHRYHGSVVDFGGDGVVAWFAGDVRPAALTAALDMDDVVRAAAGTAAEGLRVKVALVHGDVRRFVVGDPQIRLLDVLAGPLMDELAATERLARSGEVVVPERFLEGLRSDLRLGEPREDPGSSARVTPVLGIGDDATHAPKPWPPLPPDALPDERLRRWLLASVHERLALGEEFLAGLRSATALFAGWQGVDYDRDDAGSRLDALVRDAQSVFQRYDGSFIQLATGDKGSHLFAAFGAPVAHDDDPARALAAAADLQALAPAHGLAESFRIAVATGSCYVGAYGGPEAHTYGVIGPMVNLAARLMVQASPTRVVCDHDTQRIASGHWSFERLPSIRVKGLAGLVRAYAVSGRRTDRVARVPAKTSTFVGRVRELRRLRDALDDLEAGSGGVVFIEGEEGIGKSRLVAELVGMIRERGWTGLLGAGRSIEQHTPYRAWRDVFTSYFGLDDVADPSERRARVHAVVDEILPAMVGRTPLLGELLGFEEPDTPLTASLDARGRQESLVGLLIALLRAWAIERPLILVLEDAHWLDGLSWELAVQVARALLAARERLLFVVAARPLGVAGMAAASAANLRSVPGGQTLVLDALPPGATLELVARLLGVAVEGIPGPLAELVTTRAEGNPFFAEELVHALVGQGTVRVEIVDGEPRCSIGPSIERELGLLPDTIHGLTLARIDRLPADRQLTLKVAAVIGRTFSVPPLRDTLALLDGIPEPQLADHLAELVRLDLTRLEVLEPEIGYVFKHMITQEVAYRSLLFSQRRRVHRLVGEWYERRSMGDDPAAAPPVLPPAVALPLLVHHFAEAGDAARERRYARLAGERAASQFANAAAVRFLTRAIELTDEADVAELIDLLLAREAVLDSTGDTQAQAADIARLESIVPRSGEPAREAAVALRRANHELERSSHATARSAADAALDAARRAGDRALEAAALMRRGAIGWREGAYGRAREDLTQALAIAASIGDLRLQADTANNLAITSDLAGERQQARTWCERGLVAARELGDPKREASLLNTMGVVEWRQGRWEQATATLERSLALKREIGARNEEAISLGNLAMLAGARGDHDGVRMYADEALRLAREMNNRYAESRILGILANELAEAGDLAEARDAELQALRLAREAGDRQDEVHRLFSLGRIDRLLGRYAEGRTRCQESLALAREIGDRDGEAFATRGLGTIAARTGDSEAAIAHCERAVSLGDELSGPSERARDRLCLGDARRAAGQAAGALEAYREAAGIVPESETGLAVEIAAGTAQVLLAAGDIAAAVDAVEPILRAFADGLPAGLDEPGRVELACVEVLVAARDPRALPVLDRAHARLEERAARLEDDDRRTFLEAIPEHRELRRSWAELSSKAGAVAE